MADYDAFISYSHDADSQLAEALQLGLERLRKPWYQRRPFLRILRDETSFAASPHLSDRIYGALDSADHMVLLLSPESAASPWTNQEVQHWLETRGVDAMTFVVTRWALDREQEELGDLGRFRWHGTDVPEALRGQLDEPLAVDMRWVEEPASISLTNERFEDNVAEIAAAIRGEPKDHLVGALVAMQTRARILTSAVALGVLILLAAIAVSVPGWWAARRAADNARDNEAVALAAERSALERQASAEAAAGEAETQRAIAEAAAEEAQSLLVAAEEAAANADRLREEAVAAEAAAERARDSAQADAAAAQQLQVEAERLRIEAEAAAATAAALRDQALAAQAAAEEAAERARQLQADAEASADLAQRTAFSRRLGTISLSLEPARSDAAALVAVEGVCALAGGPACSRAGARANVADGAPPTVESVDAIVRAVAGRPGLVHYVQGFPSPELTRGPRTLALNGDGTVAAIAGGSDCFSIDPNDVPGQVAIWTSLRAEPTQIFGLELGPRAIELADRGTRLIAAGVCDGGGGLQVIDWATDTRATADASHLAEFSAVSVAGDLVATVDVQGAATAWNLTGEPAFDELATEILDGAGLAVHADKTAGMVTAIGDTGDVVRFQAEGSQGRAAWNIGTAAAATFDSSGRFVAAARSGGVVHVYELSDTGPTRIAELDGSAPVLSMRFDAAGEQLVVTGVVGIEVWDLERNRRIGEFATDADSATFFPGGGRLIAAGAAEITTWSLKQRALRSELPIDATAATAAALSADGTRLALATPDEVTVWRLADELSSVTLPVSRAGKPMLRLSGDGSRLAMGGHDGDGSVELWSLGGPSLESTIDAGQHRLIGIDLTPDGTIAATLAWVGSFNSEVRVWDVSDIANPRQASRFRIRGGPISIAVRPDGAVVAVTGMAGHTSLYNAISGTELATDLGRHPEPGAVSFVVDPIDHVVFFDRGTKLASASFYTGTIVLWDVADPTNPAFVAGPFVRAGDNTELSIAVAGDLPVIATQPGLELWNRDLGTALAVAGLEPGQGWFAAYSRATESLISVGDSVMQWGFGPSHWVDAACSLAARNLTEDEWATWVGGPYRETCRG